MKCDELKPIELECNMGKDINGVEHREPWKAYDIDEVDAAIEELKDKCQMHDFFWEGCGFAKRGFKNTIAVSEAFDKLEAEDAELKAKLDSMTQQFSKYVVDANNRERRLKRALWLARAERAKEHVWHDVKTDGSPRDDYKGHDWVLVQYQENGGFLLIPRIAEYRKNLKRWVLIDENDITPHHDYLLKDCRVIGWRDIDFAYYGRKFFVQQEINKNVERKCLKKAEEYK